MIDFWNNVNKIIKEKGETQKSMNAKCGFSDRRIENLSGGKRSPDVKELMAMSKVLGVSLDYLCTGKENNLPDDISEVAQRMTELTPEQRAPLIFMVNSQIDFYKR